VDWEPASNLNPVLDSIELFKNVSTSTAETPSNTSASAFRDGLVAAWTSAFALVIIGTFVGVGALAHDYGFDLLWLVLCTVLIWAAPAQVILISALGAGAPFIEVALAVALSAVRLLPMVVSMLPLLRTPDTRMRDLVLPGHFTAASTWVESFRLLPSVAPERRVAFCNGLGCGFMAAAEVGGAVGYYLAASLPVLLTAALLFLTPLSFLMSSARNSRMLSDRLALGFGLMLSPLLVYLQIGLDLMWTGLVAGSAAYGVHLLRRALR
jgi:predicted branched-subunit amino acid permease